MQSLKLEPIYLPEVETNPHLILTNMIRSLQVSGREYWQIWHLAQVPVLLHCVRQDRVTNFFRREQPSEEH